MATTIVGILNCTPDSFSDGDQTLTPSALCERGQQLIDEGADMLDIGGDSTRPNSACPGVEEEWRRIAPVLAKLSGKIPCSVDTHHVEVARRAIEGGARLINDISGTLSPDMVSLVASHRVTYIFMFNAHGGPHLFGEGLRLPHAFSTIREWIASSVAHLTNAGLSAEKLIADPGMGAFLSDEPRVSWEVLSRFHELPAPRGGLLLGCSRKGFLRAPLEETPQSRDLRSCKAGAAAVSQVHASIPTYLRVHNVAMQRDVLTKWTSMSESERSL
jgi:dihydropteroate synthase